MTTKLGKLEVRVADSEPIGDHLEIKLKQEFDNQYFQSLQHVDGEGYLKLRISLDTAIKLAEFIDREIEELAIRKMRVGV
jgi:hypothetical protein